MSRGCSRVVFALLGLDAACDFFVAAVRRWAEVLAFLNFCEIGEILLIARALYARINRTLKYIIGSCYEFFD